VDPPATDPPLAFEPQPVVLPPASQSAVAPKPAVEGKAVTSSRRRLRPYYRFRAASAVANALPERLAVPLASRLASWAVLFVGNREMVARHQRRASSVPLDGRAVDRAVRGAFASYGRYWMESFRVPSMDPERVAAGLSIEGLAHLEAARAAGKGAILAIPHLGGWDVGGAWFVRKGFPLTVVVEPLEPPELFEWFVRLRQSFGFTVVPLGLRAGTAVIRALRANQIVALLADRDIGGGGVEVDFFGERTTLPAGPATLARRMQAPLHPTAIFFRGRGHHVVIRPAVSLEGSVADVTQRMATEMAALIRRAPDQWHLFQPNWPSDREHTL
jgi:phosphatidylinositol dimannoside acyltransferase